MEKLIYLASLNLQTEFTRWRFLRAVTSHNSLEMVLIVFCFFFTSFNDFYCSTITWKHHGRMERESVIEHILRIIAKYHY